MHMKSWNIHPSFHPLSVLLILHTFNGSLFQGTRDTRLGISRHPGQGAKPLQSTHSHTHSDATDYLEMPISLFGLQRKPETLKETPKHGKNMQSRNQMFQPLSHHASELDLYTDDMRIIKSNQFVGLIFN